MMNCARSAPGNAPIHSAAAHENRFLAAMAASASSVRTSGTVGPRPFAYCSVAPTGTPNFCAARTSHTALATTCLCSWIAGTILSCKSRTSSIDRSRSMIMEGLRSAAKLGTIAELLERFGIGERLEVLDRQAVHDIAHRKLHDLVALRPRYVGHLHDAGRYVARRRVGANVRANPLDERFVERNAVLKLYEQHDAHVAHFARWPVLTDHEALDNLGQLLHLPIDFGGADAHAAGIQGGVGAAVDHEAIVLGQLDIVAMAPDVRKALEVGGMVFGAVGVVPESDGHRGKWRRADKLAAD